MKRIGGTQKNEEKKEQVTESDVRGTGFTF